MNFNFKKSFFDFRFVRKKKPKLDSIAQNFKTYDPDRKKYACAYCGDKFPNKTVRASHEKSTHIDSEGREYFFIYFIHDFLKAN